MKNYIDLSTSTNTFWACSWNNGEILEIHTPETFKAKYDGSIFIDESSVNNDHDWFEYLTDYFKNRLLGAVYELDNMTIILIKV
jgi:hypothetical protein